MTRTATPTTIKPASAARKSYTVPLKRVPEAIWKTLRHQDKSGISKLTWVTSLIPLIAVPGLISGLSARTFTDADLKSFKSPNPILQFLRNLYPPAYTLMMVCGVLNGIAYASLSRIISYMLLLAGSAYVWQNEVKRNAALEELAKIHSDPNHSDNNESDHEYDLRDQAAEATAAISAFSRIFYGLAISITCLANISQTTVHKKLFPENWSLFKPDNNSHLSEVMKERGLLGFECYVPEAKDFQGFTKEFKENLIPNFKKEVSAGTFYFKELLNPAKWVDSWKVLSGNSEFEKEVLKRGGDKNQFKRILLRLGEPELNCRLTAINGVLRVASVAGTAYAVANLGGIQVFNNEDPLLSDDDIVEMSQQKPAMKAFYDFMMFLNNIGLFLMGAGSISTGFNKQYELVSGAISSILQTTGGSLLVASAICDQVGLFLIGQALKLGSNGALQLANVFATCNKAVPNLVNWNMMKGLTLATA